MWVMTVVGIKVIYKPWRSCYEHERDRKIIKEDGQMDDIVHCPLNFTINQSANKRFIKRTYLFFTLVVLTIFKVVWDAIDVSFDIYTFINLENGELINGYIQRNAMVTNAIMVFACLGVLKIPINIYILYDVPSGETDDGVKYILLVGSIYKVEAIAYIIHYGTPRLAVKTGGKFFQAGQDLEGKIR